MTYVSLSPCLPVPEDEYIASPLTSVLLRHNVALPFYSLYGRTKPNKLAVLEFRWPLFVPPTDAMEFSAASTDVRSRVLGSLKDPPPISDDIANMMSSDLSPSQARELHQLLASYMDTLDLDDRPFGQMSEVTHRISTGDADPTHQRPYRMSHTERAVIQNEGEQMLNKYVMEP